MFFVITIKFHKQLLKAPPVQRQRQVFQLLYIVYAVLVAITVRFFTVASFPYQRGSH